MDELTYIRDEINDEVCRLRRFDYLLRRIEVELWKDLSYNEMKRIKDAARRRDMTFIAEILKRHDSESSMGTLKNKAKNLGIKNYSRLNKYELISSINAELERRAAI